MPTLTQRINTLTAAIATAINNRTISPASGYDIARLNGYTGTQAQWLADFSDPGNTDYATQFNNQLGTLPTAGIATEGQVGTTQLVTLAEALAGTNSAKALSALRHANVHVATTLADLNSKAASLPSGSLVAMAQQDYSAANNGYLYRSIWFIDHLQRATVFVPLITDIAATLTYLTSVCGSGKTYPNVLLDRGVIEALVGTSTTGFRTPYWYNGATWGVRANERMQAMGYANAAQSITASNLNAIQTQTILSDPTGLMAPAAASPANWNAPWVGRYRFSMALALNQNVPAGSYAGITVYQTANSAQTSLGDNGYRILWQAGDVMRFSTDFYVNTAGAVIQCMLYAQMSANGATVNGGAWTTTDPKNTRVVLEYLGI